MCHLPFDCKDKFRKYFPILLLYLTCELKLHSQLCCPMCKVSEPLCLNVILIKLDYN